MPQLRNIPILLLLLFQFVFFCPLLAYDFSNLDYYKRTDLTPLPIDESVPLTYGILNAKVNWDEDPITEMIVLRSLITFTPTSSLQCNQISFIQTARVDQEIRGDYEWLGGEEPRNFIKTKSTKNQDIVDHFFIDHKAFHCEKGLYCSPYYRDHWPNLQESGDGISYNDFQRPASLADFPFGWDSMERIVLEACAFCKDDKRLFGCIIWGAQMPLFDQPQMIIPKASDVASPTFIKALDLFVHYYDSW